MSIGERGLFYIQWHITNKCNLRCTHCYQEKYQDELTVEQFKEYYYNINSFLSKSNNYASIALTGGEPFVYEHLYEILDFLNAQPRVKQIILLTNGTLIDKEEAKKLKGRVKRVQISLDGGRKEVHEAVRGKDNFEKALNGIKNLREQNIEVQVQMAAQKNNVKSLDDLIKVCNKVDVNRLLVTTVIPEGNAAENLQDKILTKEDYKELIYKLNNYSNDPQNTVKILKGRQLWRLIDETKGSICPVGISSTTIMPDGIVYPCRRLPIKIGNLNESSFFKIWFSSKLLLELREKSNLKGNCGKCEEKEKCSGCRAVAYGITGDYLSEDPYCWKFD